MYHESACFLKYNINIVMQEMCTIDPRDSKEMQRIVGPCFQLSKVPGGRLTLAKTANTKRQV